MLHKIVLNTNNLNQKWIWINILKIFYQNNTYLFRVKRTKIKILTPRTARLLKPHKMMLMSYDKPIKHRIRHY